MSKCCDMLKYLLLQLKNYLSQGSKSIHFCKGIYTDFSKTSESFSYRWPKAWKTWKTQGL